MIKGKAGTTSDSHFLRFLIFKEIDDDMIVLASMKQNEHGGWAVGVSILNLSNYHAGYH